MGSVLQSHGRTLRLVESYVEKSVTFNGALGTLPPCWGGAQPYLGLLGVFSMHDSVWWGSGTMVAEMLLADGHGRGVLATQSSCVWLHHPVEVSLRASHGVPSTTLRVCVCVCVSQGSL